MKIATRLLVVLLEFKHSSRVGEVTIQRQTLMREVDTRRKARSCVSVKCRAGYILVAWQTVEQIPRPTTWQVMFEGDATDEQGRVRRD